MTAEPQTLMEAIRQFADPDVALDFMVEMRWPNGVACPTCGQVDPTWLPSVRRWQCKAKHPKRQFSVKVGTVMEDSPIGLDKWLGTIWMLVNDRNGISSYEVARSIGVTQKSAWFMLQRIRLALEDGTFNRMKGEVEADETYIGGKARNMHKDRKAKTFGTLKPNGMMGKAGVMGFIQREGPNGHSVVRTIRIEDNRRGTIEGAVREHVEPGSALYTDGLGSYRFLGDEYAHGVVEHDAKEYVRGEVHTNRIENFWGLLKRSLGGTYISVEPFHLFRYLDEQVFRFNTRQMKDGERFKVAAAALVGKRLTYAQLISSGAQSLA
ncbi:MAG: IS1595 family transposase [Dehalococcoidia bacterium]|nr:IS1595 family transposase [Dehalococcoidia bacterium]